MTPRTYETPAAFKQALEGRLRAEAGDGNILNRRRQLLVFSRFLARVVQVLGDAVTLKGGLVLEHRLQRARMTKDVDLCLVGSIDTVLTQLQVAGRLGQGAVSLRVQTLQHLAAGGGVCGEVLALRARRRSGDQAATGEAPAT